MTPFSENLTMSDFALVLILSPGVPDDFKMLDVVLPLGLVELPETLAEPVAVKFLTVMSAVESIDALVTEFPNKSTFAPVCDCTMVQ